MKVIGKKISCMCLFVWLLCLCYARMNGNDFEILSFGKLLNIFTQNHSGQMRPDSLTGRLYGRNCIGNSLVRQKQRMNIYEHVLILINYFIAYFMLKYSNNLNRLTDWYGHLPWVIASSHHVYITWYGGAWSKFNLTWAQQMLN